MFISGLFWVDFWQNGGPVIESRLTGIMPAIKLRQRWRDGAKEMEKMVPGTKKMVPGTKIKMVPGTKITKIIEE